MRDFVLASKLAKKTVDTGDLYQIKAFLKNIGSNFILQGKKFGFLAKPEWGLALNWGRCSSMFGFYELARTEFSPYAKATEDKKKRF